MGQPSNPAPIQVSDNPSHPPATPTLTSCPLAPDTSAAPPERSPVEFEVWGEDELSRMVHGPPHQAQHQDLQPAALQQVDLVGQTQLHEA